MTIPSFPLYLALIESDNHHFLMTDRGGALHGFQTEREGLGYFEGMYHRAHARGSTWSAGAMLHHMFFRPTIVRFETMDDVNAIVQRAEDDGQLLGCSRQTDAGSMTGILVKPDAVEALKKGGVEPTLVAR